MNENLLTLKQIADQIGVNYRTLVSCKNRFEDFVHGVPVGRIARYPEDFTDFFRLVFALFDEGYSTGNVRELLLNGVEAKEDAFIESWLEEWRANLKLKLPDREEEDTATGGRIDEGMNGRPDDLMNRRMDGGTDERMDGGMNGLTDGGTNGPMDGSTDGGMN